MPSEEQERRNRLLAATARGSLIGRHGHVANVVEVLEKGDPLRDMEREFEEWDELRAEHERWREQCYPHLAHGVIPREPDPPMGPRP